MQNTYDWTRFIQERTSVRTYEEKNIKSDSIDKLIGFIRNTNTDANRYRFELIEKKLNDESQSIKLGTYGVIKGTDTYIAGIIHNTSGSALEMGFLLEKIILYATGLGLGTCWLGGTYNRKDFENYLSLNEDETLAVLIAIGYKKDKQSLIESTMRLVAKSDQRKPWKELFFDHSIDSALSPEMIGAYAKVLEMVRIAPSASNKQPWRIIKDENKYNVYLCRTPGYGIKTYDLQLNDIGIAKCHFELCANELNLKGHWSNDDLSCEIPNWEYVCTWYVAN